MTRMKDLLGIPFLQNSKIFVQAEDLCSYISITKRKGEICLNNCVPNVHIRKQCYV